jgi:hypothetical protein
MGKPASADGGKGIGALTFVRAHAPELPGQASKAAGSPFAETETEAVVLTQPVRPGSSGSGLSWRKP